MTKLVRFTPNDEMRRMQREFDRLFDSFFTPGRLENGADLETTLWTPRVDLAETEDAYQIVLDVPGMSKEDFQLNYHEGVLSVSGDRKQEEAASGANFVRVERRFGHFYRSFNLPKAVDESGIKATYTDGVLRIRVPKAEAVKPRRIKVQ